MYEDPKCSMSMWPLYSLSDHLVYFDVDFGSVLGQPLIFAYLPFNLLNPVDVIPPVPKPIEKLAGTVGSELVAIPAPYIG